MAEPQTSQPNSAPTALTPPSTPRPTSSTNGTNGAGWLPEDLTKQYPSLSNFKDVGALAKSYGEMVKYQGTSVRLPQPDAPPEAWEAFYNKVGRPEAPDKYEIKFPDGMEVDQNLLSSFRGAAHQLGLTQKQAAGITEWFAQQSTGLMDNQTAASQADQAKWADQLKAEWGYAADRNTAIAAHYVATAVKGDTNHPLVKLLDETGLGNHPALIRFFYEQGLAAGEDQFVDDRGPSELDKRGAEEELASLTPSPNEKYDRNHPWWRPETQKRAMELRELIDQYNQRQG